MLCTLFAHFLQLFNVALSDKLIGLIELKHPELSLPPVVTLLADLPLSAYVLYRLISALRFP